MYFLQGNHCSVYRALYNIPWGPASHRSVGMDKTVGCRTVLQTKCECARVLCLCLRLERAVRSLSKAHQCVEANSERERGVRGERRRIASLMRGSGRCLWTFVSSLSPSRHRQNPPWPLRKLILPVGTMTVKPKNKRMSTCPLVSIAVWNSMVGATKYM